MIDKTPVATNLKLPFKHMVLINELRESSATQAIKSPCKWDLVFLLGAFSDVGDIASQWGRYSGFSGGAWGCAASQRGTLDTPHRGPRFLFFCVLVFLDEWTRTVLVDLSCSSYHEISCLDLHDHGPPGLRWRRHRFRTACALQSFSYRSRWFLVSKANRCAVWSSTFEDS